MGQNLCYCYTNNSKNPDDININIKNKKQINTKNNKQNTNNNQNNFIIQTTDNKFSYDDEFKLKKGQKESENKMVSERYDANHKSKNILTLNVGISNDNKIEEIVGSGNTEINVFNSKENINNFKPNNSLKNSSTKINEEVNNENIQSNNNIEIEENENNENNNEENYNFIEDENDINNNNM